MRTSLLGFGFSQRRSLPRSLSVALPLLGLLSCGDNRGAVRLQLQVDDGLRARIKSLRITTLTRGRDNELWRGSSKAPSSTVMTAAGAPRELTMVVPADTRGQLAVGVIGIDENGAELLRGRGQALIENAADTARLTPVAIALTQPHCVPEGWCWSHPQPQGQHINGLFGTAPDNIWAVGSGGAILHYDGIGWNGVPSPTAAPLFGIHGSGPTDIWAVGGAGGTTLHYDGNAWTVAPNPSMQPLRAVWSVAPTSAWAVGAAGTVLRFEGSAWKDVTAPGGRALHGVWAASADDVFVAGDGGALRWRAGNWDPTIVTPPINPAPGSMPADLRGVWGSSVNDVYFVGPAGALLHWNGGGFDSINVISGANLTAIGGRGADDLWAVGANGTVLHRSGVAAGAGASMGWRTTESYTGSGLGAIWAASRDLAWVSGNDGALQRWDGGRFWNIPQRETTAGLLSIHAAASGNSLWAVGERGTLLRWNGVYWEPTWIDSVETVRDVWSDGPDRAWAVGGNGLLLRWDGSRWLRVDSGERTELMALFGVDASDLWAAGRGGVLLHFDGARWQRTSGLPTADLNDVWGRSSNDLWAVGNAGTVLHWDGQSWLPAGQGAPPAQNLLSIWGTATELYAAGSNGTLLRRDKDQWQPIASGLPMGVHINGMWGRAENDIWLSGGDGRLYRFNGSVVVPASVLVPADAAGTPRPLYRLRGDSQGQLFVVGAQGTIVMAPTATACAGCGTTTRALSLEVSLDGFATMAEVKRLSVDVYGGNKRLPGSPFELQPGRSPFALPLPSTFQNPLTLQVVAYGEGGTEIGAGRDEIELAAGNDALSRSVRVRAGCSGDGWCLSQSPTKANLIGIWGAAADAVWAVGESGTMLRWNGSAWALEPSATVQHLRGVWGTGRDDVWAAGDPQGAVTTIVHRDASAWQAVTAPILRVIGLPLFTGASLDRGTVYVPSTIEGSVLQLSAGLWSYLASHGQNYGCTQLYSMWSSGGAAGDLWAVGGNCALRMQRGLWAAMTPPRDALTAVWGSGTDDVWAVGNTGTIYRYNGKVGSEVTPKPTTQHLRSVSGTAADDIWAVGYGDTILHYDGSRWSQRRSPTSGRGLILSGVWASSRREAWIVSQAGTILRYQS
jgi:hypothetical protein